METEPDEHSFLDRVEAWKAKVLQIPGVVAVGESLADGLPCLKVCFRNAGDMAQVDLPAFPGPRSGGTFQSPWGQPPRIVRVVSGDFFAQ